MTLFLIGLVILFVGGYFYSNLCERQIEPDDRETPAIAKADGMDFVGMSKNKNFLIELLNIAGTGPVLGPIQGILFGPIAFIAIPIGNIIGGSAHDYFNGMISMRNGGAQIPKLVSKYLGNNTRKFYNVVIGILLLLTGVVFVYTPGDLIAKDILGKDPSGSVIWIIYACIFLYYIIATLFPIDAIIGRIYPLFGAFLIISAVGIFFGIIAKGSGHLAFEGQGLLAQHPGGQKFIPAFFVTVACGILSGFHGSQSTLISRTVRHEKEGKFVFYWAMVMEGFIAMCWAGGAMVLFSNGTAPLDTGATAMVGEVSRAFMGNIGGMLAVVGVIVLPITSGDTAFRALRLIIADELGIEQRSWAKRISISLAIFIPAFGILYFAKSSPGGFNLLWRYFGFTNQFVALFALGVATVYLYVNGKKWIMPLIPGIFYTFIVFSYISHMKIGLGLEERFLSKWNPAIDPMSYTGSYVVGAVLAILYVVFVLKHAKNNKEKILETKLD